MDEVINTLIRYLAPLPTELAPGGRIHSPLKAVLFDIYGTLFISGSGDIGVAEERFNPSDALYSMCERFQIPWPPAEMSRKLFAAIKETHCRQQAVGIDHPEIKIDRIWQRLLGWEDMGRVRRVAAAYEWVVNPTYPMPGLDIVLRTLRGRGILMGIISNAQFFTPRLFDIFLGTTTQQLGFAPELTLFSYEHGCAKPSTTLFDLAVSRLKIRGVAPDAALYVGNDMRNDIRPANQAGFKTALFAGDRRSLRLYADDPAIQKTTPDLIVTDLRQILDLDMLAASPSQTSI